jgi:hypothetical protein
MDKTKLKIDEITYRGIEKITEPDELCRLFERVIEALPVREAVTFPRCIEEFRVAWAHIKDGDD